MKVEACGQTSVAFILLKNLSLPFPISHTPCAGRKPVIFLPSNFNLFCCGLWPWSGRLHSAHLSWGLCPALGVRDGSCRPRPTFWDSVGLGLGAVVPDDLRSLSLSLWALRPWRSYLISFKYPFICSNEKMGTIVILLFAVLLGKMPEIMCVGQLRVDTFTQSTNISYFYKH